MALSGITSSRSWIGVACLAVFAGSAGAQELQVIKRGAMLQRARPIKIEMPAAPVPVINPETGVAEDHESVTRWGFMCGSDESAQSDVTLRAIIAEQEAKFAPGQPVIVIDTPREGPTVRAQTLNVVFNLGGSVPANAIQSFTLAEQYLESVFNDPITFTVNVSFASMGSGVIGATGSTFINNVAYSTSRTRLIAAADAATDVQNYLPSTSTIPVRFDGTVATTSNVGTVNWTIGNARAAGVTSSNAAAGSMTYNTDFSFDYDPSNGVGGLLSLVDTIVHECGHAMGFVSATDGQNPVIETMDLYRFQRTNTGGTWNPSSSATFTSLPRLVDYNTPNDDHIVDLITAEYRMSDGSPYQASHFREQTTVIGIMDPALAGGQTFYPNYFRAPDIAVFRAMGWNNTPPCTTTISSQPSPTTLIKIAGQSATMTVGATTTGQGEISYQWRRNSQVISASNPRYSGTTSATLSIDPLATSDAGSFTCVISSDCGGSTSNAVTLTVAARCPADTDDGSGTGRPNGAVEVDDLLFFISSFEAGNLAADLDNGLGLGVPDGGVTIEDLLFFLTRFEAGC